MILAAALLAVASTSNLPDAPIAVQHPAPAAVKHNFNRYDYAIYAGVVAYRVGDYLSTEHSLANGAREVELPQAFVATKGGFAAYSLGMAGLEIGASAYLHHRGHAKIARFADALSIAGGTATDIRNIGQHGPKAGAQ